MNVTVDDFISNATQWQSETAQLRTICLDCQLEESIKWKKPCYSFQGNNIVLIQGFKEYCALLFFKGAMLQDAQGLLSKQGENSQSARIIRITSVNEIAEQAATIKAYIYEAIEVEKAGLAVTFKSNTELVFPTELLEILDADPIFKTAFESLTPGRQRAYNMFFSEPKQSKTKISRIENSKHKILQGKCMNDCVCGLSKKMPYCDGSHKYA